MYTQCTHNVHTMHTQCTHNVHTMHTKCTHNVHTMHTQCTHNAHTMLNAHICDQFKNIIRFFKTVARDKEHGLMRVIKLIRVKFPINMGSVVMKVLVALSWDNRSVVLAINTCILTNDQSVRGYIMAFTSIRYLTNKSLIVLASVQVIYVHFTRPKIEVSTPAVIFNSRSGSRGIVKCGILKNASIIFIKEFPSSYPWLLYG